MNEKVIVIEDEHKISDAIAYALKREGYLVELVYRGDKAMEKIKEFRPDAIILDIMLPGIDGYDVLKKMQEEKSIGVIMLTAKEDIINKIVGLELGADDYMTKPFDMRELLARLKSLLRRINNTVNIELADTISLNGIELELNKRSAYAGDKILELTPKEYDLLALLISSPNRVYSREQLLDLVWGMEYIGSSRTIDIHIQRIRKKLGVDFSETIQTLHGVGYKALGGSGENEYKD